MIITASSPDEFYFNQLLAFLSSMKINSPNHLVSVFLTNYPEDICWKLKASFPQFQFERRDLKKYGKGGIEYILFRIALIDDIFYKKKCPVSWIDTDVIVRGDLSEFLSVNPRQLKILYRGDKKPNKVKFNAGIFSLGCSDQTHFMVKDWYKGLIKNPVWGMGQLELWKSYSRNQKNVKLVKMHEKFNDLGGLDRPNAFDKDSVMWHCKKPYFNNPKFQKEFQKYLAVGKELYYEK